MVSQALASALLRPSNMRDERTLAAARRNAPLREALKAKAFPQVRGHDRMQRRRDTTGGEEGCGGLLHIILDLAGLI